MGNFGNFLDISAQFSSDGFFTFQFFTCFSRLLFQVSLSHCRKSAIFPDFNFIHNLPQLECLVYNSNCAILFKQKQKDILSNFLFCNSNTTNWFCFSFPSRSLSHRKSWDFWIFFFSTKKKDYYINFSRLELQWKYYKINFQHFSSIQSTSQWRFWLFFVLFTIRENFGQSTKKSRKKPKKNFNLRKILFFSSRKIFLH